MSSQNERIRETSLKTLKPLSDSDLFQAEVEALGDGESARRDFANGVKRDEGPTEKLERWRERRRGRDRQRGRGPSNEANDVSALINCRSDN